MRKINEICIEYARKYGGGLPLTPEELCNATVLWVEQQIKTGGGGVSLETLSELIVGSETIVVDINESGDALEIHLDYEVIQKIDRAILIPISAPTSQSVPVVNPNKSVEYKSIAELGGGSSITLYRLSLEFDHYQYDFIMPLKTISEEVYVSMVQEASEGPTLYDFMRHHAGRIIGSYTSISIESPSDVLFLTGDSYGGTALTVVSSGTTFEENPNAINIFTFEKL